MDKRSRRDLLSDLPLSIIHSILALVPIRDAVKTSVLSRQWRYKWITLPHLVFDDECASDKTSLTHFVTQALFLHKGPVQKFKLSSDESCCIDRWVLFLSRNDVSTLILNAEESEDSFQIHSSLYSCENLTHLELRKCEVPPPPLPFNGFLYLRCLILQDVELSVNTVESLLANSSLLEELILDHSPSYKFGSSELKICAPNLKSFWFSSDYIEICLYAPRLAIMSAVLFTMDFIAEPLQQKNSACNYTKFLGSLTNLEELTGLDYFVKYLSIGVEPTHNSHNSLVFPHLRAIDLTGVMFGDVKQIWVVVRLITGAPNLHRLEITCDGKHTPKVASISFWDSEFAPSFRFERLKVIDMSNVHGELNEMKLAKFLLASSPVLERLSFTTSFWNTDDHKSLKLATELLSYPRASTNAQILFSNFKTS